MISLTLLALGALGGLFLASNTPHILVASLLLSTLLSALMLGALKSFPWLAYVLFLVFLGGVLILFTYVSSLSSNPLLIKMKMETAMALSLVTVLFIWVGGAPPSVDTHVESSVGLDLSMKELFTPLQYPLYLYLFIYLLLTLLYIVALMKIYYAPLRSSI